MDKWFVSRQSYWPTGELVVEIAYGGLDYANPGMLADQDKVYGKWEGEYKDPRKVLKAAFNIRDVWHNELYLTPGREDRECRIEVGSTGGYTLPFEEHPTDEDLKAWAAKAWAEVEKCDGCGAILPDPYIQPGWAFEDDDPKYCSDPCLDNALEKLCEEDVKMDLLHSEWRIERDEGQSFEDWAEEYA